MGSSHKNWVFSSSLEENQDLVAFANIAAYVANVGWTWVAATPFRQTLCSPISHSLAVPHHLSYPTASHLSMPCPSLCRHLLLELSAKIMKNHGYGSSQNPRGKAVWCHG